MKIDIHIKNDYKFGLVAKLVDSIKFISDINSIREKYHIKLVEYEGLNSNVPDTSKKYKIIEKYIKKYFYSKYNIGIEYSDAIMSIIYTNTIGEDEIPYGALYEHLELDDIKFALPILYPNGIDIIILHKDMLDKELSEAYQGYKQNKKSSFDTVSYIKRNRAWYWMNLAKSKGGNGMSYPKIAKDESKDGIVRYEEVERIRKAIGAYKKLLLK